MKLAVFLVLSCLGVCFVNSMKVTSWGNVTTRTLGTKNIVAKSSMFQAKNVTFTYPEGSSSFTISGIKHMDYKSHPVSVRFLRGNIGSRNITLQVQSQRGHGINSTFIFYTR